LRALTAITDGRRRKVVHNSGNPNADGCPQNRNRNVSDIVMSSDDPALQVCQRRCNEQRDRNRDPD
jgi:hypothetical protein